MRNPQKISTASEIEMGTGAGEREELRLRAGASRSGEATRPAMSAILARPGRRFESAEERIVVKCRQNSQSGQDVWFAFVPIDQ
jgi:hypothetical protein